jgi:hypothetical protein
MLKAGSAAGSRGKPRSRSGRGVMEEFSFVATRELLGASNYLWGFSIPAIKNLRPVQRDSTSFVRGASEIEAKLRRGASRSRFDFARGASGRCEPECWVGCDIALAESITCFRGDTSPKTSPHATACRCRLAVKRISHFSHQSFNCMHLPLWYSRIHVASLLCRSRACSSSF